jgi:hypothetical protein
MTSTRPCRRMILHFSHIGLTDGRTFTSLRSREMFSLSLLPALETGTASATERSAASSATNALQAHPQILAGGWASAGPRGSASKQGVAGVEKAAVSGRLGWGLQGSKSPR